MKKTSCPNLGEFRMRFQANSSGWNPCEPWIGIGCEVGLLIGTLDAIHLSTCLLYQEKANKKPVLCTHDEALKKAGLAMDLEALG